MCFIIIGKLFITTVNLFIYWILLIYTLENNETESLVIPLLIMAIMTYSISTMFLGVFDEIILAILLCIAFDMDLNNGTLAFGSPELHV